MKSSFQTNDLCLYYQLNITSLRPSSFPQHSGCHPFPWYEWPISKYGKKLVLGHRQKWSRTGNIPVHCSSRNNRQIFPALHHCSSLVRRFASLLGRGQVFQEE